MHKLSGMAQSARMKLSVCILTAAGVLATSLSACASTNALVIPFFRGQTGAESGAWDHFTVATDNGIGNAPEYAGGANAHLIQLQGNATLSGSSNIYNQDHVSRFELRDASTEDVGLVAFSVRTLGNELDYGSVKLSFDLGAGLQTIVAPRFEVDRLLLGPPGAGGGAAVTSYYGWDLSGFGVKNFTIKFDSADISVSLDSASIDTLSAARTLLVPEPSTWAMLGVGTALVAARGWRRR